MRTPDIFIGMVWAFICQWQMLKVRRETSGYPIINIFVRINNIKIHIVELIYKFVIADISSEGE